jgi:hypothetical protein
MSSNFDDENLQKKTRIKWDDKLKKATLKRMIESNVFDESTHNKDEALERMIQEWPEMRNKVSGKNLRAYFYRWENDQLKSREINNRE